MIPHLIEQYAQAKHLGTFEKSYSESPPQATPTGRVIGCMLLAIFSIPIIAFIVISTVIAIVLGVLFWIIGNLAQQPQIVRSSYNCFSFPFHLLTWPRRARLKNQQEQGKWLYVYANGFVYETPAQTQAYHVDEILSVEMHQQAHGSGDHVRISTSYRVNLDANRGFLQITHGEEVKYRFELYLHQLLNQLKHQQRGGLGNPP